jgi:hypothetical protein
MAGLLSQPPMTTDLVVLNDLFTTLAVQGGVHRWPGQQCSFRGHGRHLFGDMTDRLRGGQDGYGMVLAGEAEAGSAGKQPAEE